MRQSALILGLVAGLALVGCQAGVTPSASVSNLSPAVLAKANLQYFWTMPLPLRPGETVYRVMRLDDSVYVLTSGNRLISVDAVRGLYKWSYELDGRLEETYAPLHLDNLQLVATTGIANILDPPSLSTVKPVNAVLINTLGYYAILDRTTGQELRKLKLHFPASSPCASDGVSLYAGSMGGQYHAVRLTDGYDRWEMSTGDTISARPQYFNSRLYVASKDGVFRTLNPEPQDSTGRRPIKAKTDGPLSADFYVDARGCFVPSEDYQLYAFDLGMTAELWHFRAQGPLLQAVQVGKRSCFQYAANDRFYCIDVASGKSRWESPAGRLVLASTEPDIMLLTQNRHLQVIDEMTGQVKADLPLTGLEVFAANSTAPAAYAASKPGALVCIRPVGAPALTAEMLKDARQLPGQ